jgi:hypothetical protein
MEIWRKAKTLLLLDGQVLEYVCSLNKEGIKVRRRIKKTCRTLRFLKPMTLYNTYREFQRCYLSLVGPTERSLKLAELVEIDLTSIFKYLEMLRIETEKRPWIGSPERPVKPSKIPNRERRRKLARKNRGNNKSKNR